ncbi:MAG: uracil-DNA glycosylase [Candidatus Neomarinimicrobiota bacterium]|nr:uracil-DNA glycosylase [Candidatus Neomarinimicrobiota bacterium]
MKPELFKYLIQSKELFDDEIFLSKFNSNPNNVDNLPISGIDVLNNINVLKNEVKNCYKCSLSASRTNTVFGYGDFNASLMIVGEAPGQQEDLSGNPFVGRAGKLLDKMLTAINRSREKDVFICNVLKCRPPENRDPTLHEIKECEPYLVNQIDLIKPKLIVALGRVAGKTLLGVDKSLKDMREEIRNYHDFDLIVTYHPAALLRNPNWKPEAWNDFKWIRSLID